MLTSHWNWEISTPQRKAHLTVQHSTRINYFHWHNYINREFFSSCELILSWEFPSIEDNVYVDLTFSKVRVVYCEVLFRFAHDK